MKFEKKKKGREKSVCLCVEKWCKIMLYIQNMLKYFREVRLLFYFELFIVKNGKEIYI